MKSDFFIYNLLRLDVIIENCLTKKTVHQPNACSKVKHGKATVVSTSTATPGHNDWLQGEIDKTSIPTPYEL